MAAAVGFFGIHILSQTGLACHSRAPLSPSPQSLHPSPSSAPPPSTYPSANMWGWLGFELMIFRRRVAGGWVVCGR